MVLKIKSEVIWFVRNNVYYLTEDRYVNFGNIFVFILLVTCLFSCLLVIQIPGFHRNSWIAEKRAIILSGHGRSFTVGLIFFSYLVFDLRSAPGRNKIDQ